MKAVIHIGTGKTGTTTIQSFLAKNRDNLKKEGIFIPIWRNWAPGAHKDLMVAAGIPKEWELNPLFSFLGYHMYTGVLGKNLTFDAQRKLWEKYHDEIITHCQQDDLVVFSCEELSGFTEDEVERLKTMITPLFDEVTIVLYLRRQPELFVSFYYSLVSAGTTWSVLDFQNIPWIWDYRRIVECWSIFGKDKLKIRLYDKREFHDNDLLSDFARTVGFDMIGLERGDNENVSIDSASIEFLRLFNLYFPRMFDPWTHNHDHEQLVDCLNAISGKGKKSYHLTRNEVQHLLSICQEGNDWIAQEYLGREKLFDEDVSMYPEEVASPHDLTLEKCAEITSHLWKERCNVIHQLQQEKNAETQRLVAEVQHRDSEIQRLVAEVQHRDSEVQRSHVNLALLQQKNAIYWHYYRCKVLANITFGKNRRHYEAKVNDLHEKVRQIRNLGKTDAQNHPISMEPVEAQDSCAHCIDEFVERHIVNGGRKL